ncbi:hypothetical protein M8C21_016216 [Ambrosia artemisiifolia]|uniref:Uncharacterized protein n=1 Tax=Ambrosia artemisiifolia TaxID=4212 RepID=A0AAD5BNB5_AMBAR|nr:hypothetical protein M8C21_016216 [Ambrosia artemisiifolia]
MSSRTSVCLWKAFTNPRMRRLVRRHDLTNLRPSLLRTRLAGKGSWHEGRSISLSIMQGPQERAPAVAPPAAPASQPAAQPEAWNGNEYVPLFIPHGPIQRCIYCYIPIEELIEKADGFAGVFPEHKYEIVKKLQERKHICGMTGDDVNDAPTLKRVDIGIAVADATDAARGASDIVLTEPGLSVIMSAVLTSRAIFQRMKNCTIYAVSITIRVVLGFMLLALIWKFDFSPFMVLILLFLTMEPSRPYQR